MASVEYGIKNSFDLRARIENNPDPRAYAVANGLWVLANTFKACLVGSELYKGLGYIIEDNSQTARALLSFFDWKYGSNEELWPFPPLRVQRLKEGAASRSELDLDIVIERGLLDKATDCLNVATGKNGVHWRNTETTTNYPVVRAFGINSAHLDITITETGQNGSYRNPKTTTNYDATRGLLSSVCDNRGLLCVATEKDFWRVIRNPARLRFVNFEAFKVLPLKTQQDIVARAVRIMETSRLPNGDIIRFGRVNNFEQIETFFLILQNLYDSFTNLSIEASEYAQRQLAAIDGDRSLTLVEI